MTSPALSTSSLATTTKFEYTLNCGFERDLKLRHHPTVVIRQAWNYTSLKYIKEWNKGATMLPEACLIYRWNLVKQMLINEGMTSLVREWYMLLPAHIQELPLSEHAYYAGETLMTYFDRNFKFPNLEEHYQGALEKMKAEKVQPSDDNQQLQDLLRRAFRVQSIHNAVGTLSFMAYFNAVVQPFPKGSEIIKTLIDLIRDPATHTWPTFFDILRNTVTHRGLFSSALFDDAEPPKEDSKDKKVSWAALREQTKSPDRYKSRMHALVEDANQGDTGEEDDRLFRSWFDSKMNAMAQEEQSVRNLKQLSLQRQEPTTHSVANTAQTQQVAAIQEELRSFKDQVIQLIQTMQQRDLSVSSMNSVQNAAQNRDDLQYMRDQISSLQTQLQQVQRTPTPSPANTLQDSNPRPPPSRKRSHTNSNQPTGGGQARNDMSKYGPGAGGQDAKQGPNKRSRTEDRVDRYLHNPPGPENWKKWFRVCNNCGKYVAHYEKICKDSRRYNYVPNEDPRRVQPIESYPSNYANALERAKQEFKIYGARVKWNCLDNVAPSPSDLA